MLADFLSAECEPCCPPKGPHENLDHIYLFVDEAVLRKAKCKLGNTGFRIENLEGKLAIQHCALSCNKGLDIDAKWASPAVHLNMVSTLSWCHLVPNESVL